MDPNNQNNPYEFIMNPSKPVRRNPLTGGSFMMKIVLIVGLGGIIMLILGIVASSMSSGSSTETILGIAQRQAELNRVAAVGANGARNQKIRNFGANSMMTYQTNVRDTVNFLGTQGVKVTAKELGKKKDPVTDQKLTVAKNASELDTVFMQVMQAETKAYQVAVQSAYKATKSKKEQQLLSTYFSQSQLLLEQSNLPY